MHTLAIISLLIKTQLWNYFFPSQLRWPHLCFATVRINFSLLAKLWGNKQGELSLLVFFQKWKWTAALKGRTSVVCIRAFAVYWLSLSLFRWFEYSCTMITEGFVFNLKQKRWYSILYGCSLFFSSSLYTTNFNAGIEPSLYC